MTVWAILVAAGRGERLGLDHPKAFAKLGEDPLLAEPLRRLENSEWIDGIVEWPRGIGWIERLAVALAESRAGGAARSPGYPVVAMPVRGHRALTAMPSGRNSPARPSATMLMPNLAML